MFSNLPDDCVLKVLDFIEVEDLDEMSCVSQYMFDLARFQLAKTPKKRAQKLKISEKEDGHVFELFHGKTELNYGYAIDKGESPRDIRLKYKGVEEFNAAKNKYEKLTCLNGTKYELIPSPFFENLEKLLDRNSFAGLVLTKIRINSSFLRCFENTMSNIEWIKMDGVKVDSNCIHRFFSIILEHKLQKIEIHNPERALSENFNETFLDVFSKERESSNLQLMVTFNKDETYRFFASKNAVDYLLRFHQIWLKSLVLNKEWVVELIQKRLKIRKPASIIISVTGMPNRSIFERILQFRSKHEGEYIFDDVRSKTRVRMGVHPDAANPGGFHLLTCFSLINDN